MASPAEEMDSIGAFFAMGGYAAFVWPAFAVTLGLMGIFAALALRRLRRTERTLRALEQAAGRGAEDGES